MLTDGWWVGGWDDALQQQWEQQEEALQQCRDGSSTSVL